MLLKAYFPSPGGGVCGCSDDGGGCSCGAVLGMLVAGGVPSVARLCASRWIPLLSLPPPPMDGESKLSIRLLKKKAMASTVVALDKNVAAPRPPKTALVIPEPPKAPARPSPLADCIRTTMIKAMQMITCKMVNNAIKDTS